MWLDMWSFRWGNRCCLFLGGGLVDRDGDNFIIASADDDGSSASILIGAVSLLKILVIVILW
jgi:hypothetical protein